MKSFRSNGKLLISGEYVVLDGAMALALPTKYGQSLTVESLDEPKLVWTSLDTLGAIWFKDEFLIKEIVSVTNSSNAISERLIQILNAAKQLNPKFLNSGNGFKVTTTLEFPKNWGLGTSSTLINNIAQWANIDAYQLLKQTFGGSGYDIACAQHNTPITYQLEKDTPKVKVVDFNPTFKKHLYFVYLNKKQNSRDGIKHYNDNKEHLSDAIKTITSISTKMMVSETLSDFETLLTEHENIIASITKQTPVKTLFFNDFNGSIKSLGAWGGDFILAASKENPIPYFKSKGFETVIPYADMILS